ncbi:MAG TPA: FAD-dependent oxidoreductase [Acidimicrobiia bacterium]|jgi:glycine/D-amino acid oxidase-like deaminating enzyme
MNADLEARYRSRSFWLDSLDGPLHPRPALDRDVDVDVAIIGAGYTGLWTAYELARRDPTLRIAVLEAEIAGFGASGRNGGWCSALFAGSREVTAKAHGRDAVVALQRALFTTVDEVGAVAAAEQIDADFCKGGTLELATAAVHVPRLRARVEHEREWGFGPGDVRWLPPAEASARLDVAELHGAVFTPHCARVHPARLARGLADAVERRGVTIHEQTRVVEISPRRLQTEGARVKADVVVRATEGYTARIPGHRRDLAPLYSLMIATEPLPVSFWDAVGWAGRETFSDGRHLIIYGQRTADDRIAFGGRGAPYHFGSRVRDGFDRDPATFAELARVLRSLFPALDGVRITHEWGGPLGVPRDWYSSVGFEPTTGLAWAGGYVGDGVGTSNLAGRTLADLILREDTERTRLAWVGHRSPPWEPEPLRWLGVNAGLALTAGLDRTEARTGRRARWRERLLARITS